MNSQDYKTAKMQLDAYENASLAYRTKHKTNGIPAEVCKTFPYSDIVNNELRSAIEVYEFINEPPKQYFLYIREKTNEAITWMGDKLGTVTFGHVYSGGFGWDSKRQTIYVNGINGVKYWGTYYKSSGDYARIKALKS